ncbi:hypothetical protein ACFL2Q_11475 [Thermodesulfobacteriota bacterium]
MGKKTAMPREIKDQVERIVEEFNETVLKDQGRYYLVRFRGRFLYLDRSDYGRVGPICRLEYRGGMTNWKFSVYKFSSGSYDSQEWFFPGSDLVDGTVEGAMRAGLQAYE